MLAQMIEVLVSLKASVEKAREDQEENSKIIIAAVQYLAQGFQQNQTPTAQEETPPTQQSSSPVRKMPKKENKIKSQESTLIVKKQSFDSTILASQVMNYQCTPESPSNILQPTFSPPQGEKLDVFTVSHCSFAQFCFSLFRYHGYCRTLEYSWCKS